MTSQRAQITDPHVRKLADEIIEAQRREIVEMRYLIAELEGDEDPTDPEIFEGDEVAGIGTVSEALSAPLIATLDPAPLHPAEDDNVLEPGPRCRFSRTAEGDPILIARAPAGESGVPQGVMKLNGKLVPLDAAETGGFESLVPGTVMAADGVRMSVRRSPDAGAILGVTVRSDRSAVC